MADSRRTRDYQPDAPLDLEFLNDPRYTPLDQIGGPGLGGAGNSSGLDPQQQELLGGIDQRLATIQQLGDQRKGLEDQIDALPPQLKTSYGLDLSGVGNALSGIGSAVGRGLSALIPSQDTLNSVGMRLQNMGAAYTGQTPLYMKQIQQQMDLAQHQDLMSQRRQQLQQYLEQLQESKRQHDMGLLERAMSHPKASVMLEQLSQDPNYSMASQAGMLSKGLKDSDYGSLQAYKEFIPEDVQQRFMQGTLPSTELNAWLDEARMNAKESAKANAKAMILKRAQDKPSDQRSPYEQSLVDEHTGKIELDKAKLAETQAQTEERLAHARNLDKKTEEPSVEKQFGQDRAAHSMRLFKRPYSQLTQKQMGAVEDAIANQMGTIQGHRSVAVQQAQLAVPDKPSAGEREKSAEAMSSLDLLDRLEGSYSPDYVGPARGRYGALLEKGYVPGDDITEGEATFRSLNATLKNKIIKLITGAQMSEPEANRILKEIPEDTNPPTVFEARLKATRENVRLLEKRRREIMSGTGIEAQGMPPVQGVGNPQSQSPRTDPIIEKRQTKDGHVIGKTQSGKYVVIQ